MRLVSYRSPGSEGPWHAGILVGTRVVPAVEAAAAAGLVPGRVESVRGVLVLGDAERTSLADAATALGERAAPLASIELGPPVPDPEKIICVGLNYADHTTEMTMEAPAAPVLFAKFRNSLVGPGAAVVLSAQSAEPDYEGELAVVIGRRCRDVAEHDALDVVAGCMPFNDVSARDLQLRTSQWLPGKALDTYAPCGPALVTSDEAGDLQDLRLVTRVNGEQVQSASTAEMIFPIPRLVAHISSLMTLEPGDLIATGTPAGVGYTHTPPRYLLPGDEVEVEIEGVGLLRNPIHAPR